MRMRGEAVFTGIDDEPIGRLRSFPRARKCKLKLPCRMKCSFPRRYGYLNAKKHEFTENCESPLTVVPEEQLLPADRRRTEQQWGEPGSIAAAILVYGGLFYGDLVSTNGHAA